MSLWKYSAHGFLPSFHLFPVDPGPVHHSGQSYRIRTYLLLWGSGRERPKLRTYCQDGERRVVLPQTVRRRNEPQTASIPDMGGVQTCPATLPYSWLSEAIVTPSWAACLSQINPC